MTYAIPATKAVKLFGNVRAAAVKRFFGRQVGCGESKRLRRLSNVCPSSCPGSLESIPRSSRGQKVLHSLSSYT